MSHATDMREKASEIAPLPWNIEPKWNGRWAVHDGASPVPVADFATVEEAVTFANHLEQASAYAGTEPGEPREVIVHERPQYLTITEGGITRFVPLDGSTPRPVFGSARGLIEIAPNFDEWWPEFEEEYLR